MVTYLLEVGTEELPASFVASALSQWRSQIPESLADRWLTPEAIEVYGTPRRLVVLLQGLPQKQRDREEEIKGPPASAAFKDGQPTKAAAGFARKQGVEVADLEIRPTDKGDFVFVQKSIPGRGADAILQELTPQWIESLEGKRFMRWGDGDLRFSRPIRWLVALLDDEVLEIVLANGSQSIASDRFSRGHRILHPRGVEIPHADAYVETLEQAKVMVDPQQRRQVLETRIQESARGRQGYAVIYEDLLAEVTDLIEYPSIAVGRFDEEFLTLPAEVITTEMIEHQRYFPVWKDEQGQELLPYFITASNGDPDKADLIAAGNERVIRARLADGQFFFKTDLTKPLASYVEKLATVTFQEQLGSVQDKVDRLRQIAVWIGEQLELPEQEREFIDRAAFLCKADLVTQMVGEFPELQGIMGEKYARASQEPEAVAVAIAEHYLPRGAGDRLPESTISQVVGISDRLDTLVSIFGLGMIPTGSGDPFALRRAANAIATIIWEKQLPLNLLELLQKTAAHFVAIFGESEHTAKLVPQLQEFFWQRVRSLLEEKGIDYDLINAVLGEDEEYRDRAFSNFLDIAVRAEFLQEIRRNGTLDTIYETVNRSTRLAAKGQLDLQQLDPVTAIDPHLFEQPSEQGFYDSLVQLLPQTLAARGQRNYQLLIDALVEIAPTVSNFFDGPDSVLVMAEDANVQTNRLNLLGLLRNHARVLADFGQIVKS